MSFRLVFPIFFYFLFVVLNDYLQLDHDEKRHGLIMGVSRHQGRPFPSSTYLLISPAS